jgi:succinate dehydrogenase / fumarate reductase cytochrome b subunit
MSMPIKEKTFASDEEKKIPKPFIMRRLHSILGLWLVVFLFEHLLINSQAALYFFDEGTSFIRMVNQLEELPYLPLIEIVFLGLPFLIHGVWGALYLRTAKMNAHQTDGSSPSLHQYKRNRAYSWQRITAWILVPLIFLHVLQMRFLDRPEAIVKAQETWFKLQVQEDAGLRSVVGRLKGEIVDIDAGVAQVVLPDAGSAIFLMVRETFKSPIMVILYSIFVIVACYHAFNGLWTFMITWGITLTRRSQRRMRTITNVLMTITTILGLMAAWGVYWTTQFQM